MFELFIYQHEILAANNKNGSIDTLKCRMHRNPHWKTAFHYHPILNNFSWQNKSLQVKLNATRFSKIEIIYSDNEDWISIG